MEDLEDFEKYQRMRDAGAGPTEVYRAAQHDGLDYWPMRRLLRHLFHLSSREAKEIMLIADGRATSLDDHQQRIYEHLEPYLEYLDRDPKDW